MTRQPALMWKKNSNTRPEIAPGRLADENRQFKQRLIDPSSQGCWVRRLQRDVGLNALLIGRSRREFSSELPVDDAPRIARPGRIMPTRSSQYRQVPDLLAPSVWRTIRQAPVNALAVLCFGREKRPSRDALKNSATSVGWIAINWVMVPIIYGALEAARSLYEFFGIPALPASTWVSTPWPILLIISLAAKDLADYWNHRAMHTRWIWPLHAIHHSDTHVNFLTSFRIHFLESIFMGLSYVLLLSWLGIPPIIGAAGSALLTLHNAYIHIDMDFGHGPFKYLLTSPRLHRWHHADHPQAEGKNLANLFPFYDVIFGTYYLPGLCDKPVGARSGRVPAFSLRSQFTLPFARWIEMLLVRTPSLPLSARSESAGAGDP